jgi:hypothetical protein
MTERTEKKYPPNCPKCDAVALCFHQVGPDDPGSPDVIQDEFSLMCVDCGYHTSHRRPGGSWCMGSSPAFCGWCGRSHEEHPRPPSAPDQIARVETKMEPVIIDWVFSDGEKLRQVVNLPSVKNEGKKRDWA